jgi:hypothetical protein
MLQKVKLFILVHNFFCQSKTVQRFTTEAKHRLRFNIPRFGNGAAGTVSFSNKNRRLFLAGNELLPAF